MSMLQQSSQSLDSRVNKIIVVNIADQTLSLYAIDSAQSMSSNCQSQAVDRQVASREITDSRLELSSLNQDNLIRTFSVSTAKNGIGSLEGTGCTPLGHHIVANKIGSNEVEGSVFVGRMPTGEVYSQKLAEDNPDRDWILSRILWLKGCEPCINMGSNEQGCCDTYQRYIYIHGTPDTEPMGTPYSHGCVRMRNSDIIWLYEQVAEGTPVHIIAK